MLSPRTPVLGLLVVTATAVVFVPANGRAAPALDREPMRIHGRLATPDGTPIHNGTIQVFAAAIGDPRSPVASVNARVDGAFTVSVPHPGLWAVRVGAPGRAEREALVEPLDVSITLPPAELPPLTWIDLRIGGDHHAASPTISVRAETEAAAVWAPVPVVVRADASGRARVPVEEWHVARESRLTVQAPGLPAVELDLAAQDAARGELVVAMPPGCDRGVVVTDANDRPMPDIVLFAADGNRGLPAIGVTDARGRATVTAPCDRPLAVTLAAPDGHRRAALITPPPPADVPTPVTIRMAPPIRVRGRAIQAGTDAPVANALVWVRRHGRPLDSPLLATHTHDDGEFELVVADQRAGDPSRSSLHALTLAAVAVNHRAVEVGLETNRPAAVVLALPPRRFAVGTIVDHEARPVDGAQVRLSPSASRHRGPVPAVVETDPEGRFLVPNPAFGAHLLEVVAAGFAPLRIPEIELEPGDGALTLGEITLGARAVLEGQVVDPEGEPIADALVVVVPAGHERPAIDVLMASQPASTRSAEDGRFIVEGLKTGHNWLIARKPGYLDSDIAKVDLPTDAPLEVTLRPAASITGWVLEAGGQGIPEALVTAEPATANGDFGAAASIGSHATTGEDGRFEIVGVHPGAVVLTARAGGYSETHLSLDIADGEALTNLEVILSAGASLRGTVRDPSGSPAADVLIGLEPVDGQRVPSALTRSDRSGSFAFGGLEPGSYLVAAEGRTGHRARRRVHVTGDISEIDIALEPGALVTGRVRDRDGRPLASTDVVLVGSSPDSSSRQATTDDTGTFRFAGVAAGSYYARATRDGYLPAIARVQVDDVPVGDLELELSSGAKLEGQLLGLPLEELSSVLVSAPQLQGVVTRLDPAGRFVLTGLPPGDVLVEIRRPGHPPLVHRVFLPEGVAETAVQISLDGGDESRD